MRRGAKLRAIGTWPLKSKFYTYLALTPIVQGSALIYPPGYCHFGNFLDENYFKQITSEFLEDEIYRGRSRKVWKPRAHRENHFLDCRIGALALANSYFVGLTLDGWMKRAAQRGVPQDLQTPDLFNPLSSAAVVEERAKRDPFGFDGLGDINKGTWR
jgi:phage terminase large subunit GpA-like protein